VGDVSSFRRDSRSGERRANAPGEIAPRNKSQCGGEKAPRLSWISSLSSTEAPKATGFNPYERSAGILPTFLTLPLHGILPVGRRRCEYLGNSVNCNATRRKPFPLLTNPASAGRPISMLATRSSTFQFEV
jgi:hypothetical protein